MAEKTLKEQWVWKKNRLKLQWWSPSVGCIIDAYKSETTWIKAIGIALIVVAKCLPRNWRAVQWLGAHRGVETQESSQMGQILLVMEGTFQERSP